MIVAENLCKQFRKIEADENESVSKFSVFKNKKERKVDFFAVDNVSLKAEKGEILGILGPNGAGKTTLLRMLGMLMDSTSGTVDIYDDNNNLIEGITNKKKSIGYLSNNTKLYHRFSIREMLRMIGEIYGIEPAALNARVEEIVDLLMMQSFADNRIERLSTGQTQRANIARCLVHSPDVYIFDEPTLGLDIISSESIIEFMKKEKQAGKTILYSTHYMEEAQYLCDRIVMMHLGKIVKEGTPDEIMEATGTDNLRDAFKKVISTNDSDKGASVVSENTGMDKVNDIE